MNWSSLRVVIHFVGMSLDFGEIIMGVNGNDIMKTCLCNKEIF